MLIGLGKEDRTAKDTDKRVRRKAKGLSCIGIKEGKKYQGE